MRCNGAEIVLKLTSRGASLTNADLEGLQRLRQVATELEKARRSTRT